MPSLKHTTTYRNNKQTKKKFGAFQHPGNLKLGSLLRCNEEEQDEIQERHTNEDPEHVGPSLLLDRSVGVGADEQSSALRRGTPPGHAAKTPPPPPPLRGLGLFLQVANWLVNRSSYLPGRELAFQWAGRPAASFIILLSPLSVLGSHTS